MNTYVPSWWPGEAERRAESLAALVRRAFGIPKAALRNQRFYQAGHLVVEDYADHAGLTVENLKASRCRYATDVRRLIVHTLRERGMTWANIGRLLDRDHSTMIALHHSWELGIGVFERGRCGEEEKA